MHPVSSEPPSPWSFLHPLNPPREPFRNPAGPGTHGSRSWAFLDPWLSAKREKTGGPNPKSQKAPRERSPPPARTPKYGRGSKPQLGSVHIPTPTQFPTNMGEVISPTFPYPLKLPPCALGKLSSFTYTPRPPPKKFHEKFGVFF